MKPRTELAGRLDVALTERRAQLADLLPSTIRPERLVQSIKVTVWKTRTY